jgi:TRAP-type C4-dicarboxylate transport system substrate-binding protein
MIFDTFQAFGAEPVTTSANRIYDSIKSGTVGAQENPRSARANDFRIYEVVKYVSMTNHMWSGFNQMAHLATWRGLPDDIKEAITRNVTRYVRQQRIDQGNINASLRDRFAVAGLIFNEVDQAPFRARLANVYATWKDKLGSKCWTLLEAEVGKLG